MTRLPLLAAACALLASCSASQTAAVTSDISTGIQAACADASAAVPVAQAATASSASAAAKVSSVAAYVQAACATGTAVAALVQNSQTLEWLGNLQGQLKAAAPTPAS